jgi:magnesium transporter
MTELDVPAVPADLLRTAAAHATSNVPVASPTEAVGAVLAGLSGHRFDSVAVAAVCDRGTLMGAVTIEALLAAPVDMSVGEVMDPRPPVVAPGTNQEHAAWQAVQHGETGLIVVDEHRRFRGLIPPQRLLAVLLEEHDEDLARIGGFLSSAASARTAATEGIFRRLWHRLPWLLVGLGGALLAAVIVGSFEEQLQAQVLIAFFVPGVVYLADAVGTQTEALIIRGLSVGIGVGRVAVREILTGVLLGLLFAVVAYPVVLLIWHDPLVAVAVALALFAASAIATVIAMALPWLIYRLGKDPAFGSGPLATVIQDLLSIIIYLVIATAVVG